MAHISVINWANKGSWTTSEPSISTCARKAYESLFPEESGVGVASVWAKSANATTNKRAATPNVANIYSMAVFSNAISRTITTNNAKDQPKVIKRLLRRSAPKFLLVFMNKVELDLEQYRSYKTTKPAVL